MASGAYLGSRGVRRSYGGVAALADLGSRLRLGITGLLGPDSAAKAALMRRLVFLLTPGARPVGAARGRRSTLGRRTPWRDHQPATPVPTAGTGLERRLSRQLIAAGPSVRRLRRGATLVEQGTPAASCSCWWKGPWRSRWTASGSARSGRAQSWGSWRCWSTTSWSLGWCPRSCATGLAC
jgi:hypothetical protein